VLSAQKYDIAVVGAGAAGICAAAAAASRGASVLLIESGARLGGSVTLAMHRCLCGLYSAQPRHPSETLNGGLQRELVTRMWRQAPTAVIPRQFGKACVLEFPPTGWESALASMCAVPGIDLHMNTRAVAVERSGNRIVSLAVEGELAGTFSIAKVIDCSGGGSVLQLLGEDVMQPMEPESTKMLGGYAIRWGGLPADAEPLRLQVPYVLNLAVAGGLLPHTAKFATFFPGPGAGEGVLKLAIPPKGFSTEEVEPFVAGTIQVLRERLPAFSPATIIEMSPRALSREGRRLRGKYTVTEQDVLSARKHTPDAVHACWPIEHWDVKNGPTYIYPPPGDHYDIPPAALQSAVIDNLYAAGTCLSATRAAAASTRAGGICLATGGKAGELAAEKPE
jgi:hypothetical protein